VSYVVAALVVAVFAKHGSEAPQMHDLTIESNHLASPSAPRNSSGSKIGGWHADPEQSTAKDFPEPKAGRLGMVAASAGGRFSRTA
jgi:hypothetical protein